MIVVLFRYTSNGISNGKIESIAHTPWILDFSKYGYLGVELFFMISGYVIFFSANNNSASRFAVSRAVRLYPSYIFAVVLTSACEWQWEADLVSLTPAKILANLTMFQFYLGYGNVDGVYWTLVYEIIFYMAVLLILISRWRNFFSNMVLFWPLAMVVAFALNVEYLPLLGGYFYYFAAGALFALLSVRQTWHIAGSLVLMLAFSLSYSVGKAASQGVRDNVEYSAPVIIFIITLFFILFFDPEFWKSSKSAIADVKDIGFPDLSSLFDSWKYRLYPNQQICL